MTIPLPDNVRRLGQLAALTLACFLAGRLALFLPPDPNNAVLWPATGLALAVLLLWGTRQWPAVALGAMLVPLAWGRPFITSALIGLGNGLALVVAARVCQRLGFDRKLLRVRDVLILSAVGGLAAPLLGAAVGFGARWLDAGKGPGLSTLYQLPTWAVWWGGDAIGTLLVAPLLLSWIGTPRSSPKPRAVAEFAIGIPVLFLAAYLGMARLALRPALFFVPVCLYAARHGLRGGTASAAAIALAASAAAKGLQGAFAGLTPTALVLSLDANLFALGAIAVVTGVSADGLRRAVEAERAAKAATRQRGEMLESVFNHSPVMVAFFRITGRADVPVEFVWVNREWERLLGWSLAEMEGLNLLAECYPDPVDRAEAADFISKAEGRWRQFHTRTRRGTVLTTEWANVRLSDGTMVAIGQDVTDRRALEEQYRHAQKMQALGLLAGGIAHDFNNMLTAILSCAEVLSEELPEESPLRGDAAEIRGAAARAAALARQLLAFSRKQTFEPRGFDLSELVKDLAGMLRRILGAPTQLRTVLAPSGCLAQADPAQVEQIVMNLAVNARDAMPSGGVLTISTSNVEIGPSHPALGSGLRPGCYASISVSDTGVGMSDEVKARIFEPFFTTKSRAKGTGLGLATVYGIVQQSGGAIEVISSPGQGTTFEVYLPRAEAIEISGPAADLDSADLEGTGETILLVEDEAPLRRVATRVLRRAGYRVLEAADADAAQELARLHGEQIALVVTDIQMPGRSGPELVDALRARHLHVPVLYVSGYTDALPTTDPRSTALLPKPYTATELAYGVRSAIKRREAASGQS